MMMEKRSSAYTAISGPDTWASSPTATSTLVINGQLVNIGMKGALQVSEVRTLNSVTGLQLQYATHTHTSPSPAVNPLSNARLDSLNSRLTWVSDPHSEELSQHVRDHLIGGGADDRVGSPQQPHLLQHGH